MRAGQRRRKTVVGDVRPDAPVGPLLAARPEVGDRRPLAQRSHLVVDHAEHPERVQRPEPLRLLLLLHVPAAVRDEDRLVALPDRLVPEVVVDATVREKRSRRERRTLQLARSRRVRGLVELQDDGREKRREGGRSRHGSGDVDLRRLHLADPVVAHVRLRKAPESARLDVRRIEDEARPVREVLQRRLPEEMLPVRARDPFTDRHAGCDQADRDRRRVDRLPRQPAQGVHHFGLEALGDAGGVEGELRPREREHARRDRATGDAGDTLELRQVRGLVEPPERPDVEEHGAIAAAREAEGSPRFRAPLAILLSRFRRRGQLGHRHPL